jgi:restriction endonuclease S subunit
VRYLDWKVSQVNRLINAKRRQIVLLQEQKQAIINKAVTKGGDGWTYRRLKTLVRDVNEKDTPNDKFYIGMENIIAWTAEFVETGVLVDGDSKKFTQGDVLFGKLRPYLAKVYMPQRNGVCSGEFLVLRGFKGFLPFLKYFLLSYDFIMAVNASTYGAKMPRANWDFIGNYIVPLPIYDEQNSIVAYLDEQCSKIDKIAAKLNEEIALFAEYRTRLISDVVTGKLDVRGVVVSEFKAVEDMTEGDEDINNEEIVENEES